MRTQKASEQIRTAVERDGWFASTLWSLVAAAGESQAPEHTEALENLCRKYWYPLYAYVRRYGYSAQDAEDLTQQFFARFLEKKYLRNADPNRGRFRSFLLTSLKNFLTTEWERARTQKRGAGQSPISLSETDAEGRYLCEPAAGDLSPERLYDRRWALTLLERTVEQLKHEYSTAGKSAQFDLLKGFLSGESTDGQYDGVAASLGQSRQTVAVAVHRLRARYRELVRREISHTVTSPGELESEMRELFQALGGGK